MEILNEVWVQILAILGGVSLSGIISAIIYGALRGAFDKTISKIDIQKITTDTIENAVGQIRKVTFTHSIQPLVESGLEKINEKANEYIDERLKALDKKLDNIILIQEKQAAYFDNSIGVSETAKEELKEAIENAKEEPVVAETIAEEESFVVVEEPVVEANATPKSSKVER